MFFTSAAASCIRRAAGTLWSGWWTLPSGRVEQGETGAEAVVRELREELELQVRPLRPVWNCFTPDARFALQWWLVEAESHATAPDPAEVAAVRWCTVEEILQLTPTFHDDIRFFVEIWPTLSTLEHHPDDRMTTVPCMHVMQAACSMAP